MHTAERTIPTHLLASLYLPCSVCSAPATRSHRLVEREGGWAAECLGPCEEPAARKAHP